MKARVTFIKRDPMDLGEVRIPVDSMWNHWRFSVDSVVLFWRVMFFSGHVFLVGYGPRSAVEPEMFQC